MHQRVLLAAAGKIAEPGLRSFHLLYKPQSHQVAENLMQLQVEFLKRTLGMNLD